MKPHTICIKRRIHILVTVTFIIIYLILTVLAAHSNAEVERLRNKLAETVEESESFVPSFLPRYMYTDDVAAFGHEYVVINEK